MSLSKRPTKKELASKRSLFERNLERVSKRRRYSLSDPTVGKKNTTILSTSIEQIKHNRRVRMFGD